MRVASVSDLHLDHAANLDILPALAAEIHRGEAEVVLIVGDVSHRDARIRAALSAFSTVAPQVAYVPGNHDVWQSPERLASGADTWTRYRTELRKLVEDSGAVYLPAGPYRSGAAAIVGTVGWYDYGFVLPEHQYILRSEEFARKQHAGLQWSDARFVRFRDSDGGDMTDAEVLEVLLDDLRAQLDALRDDPKTERILVATHHLPVNEVVLRTHSLPWEFFNAFMGSPRIGELILSYEKVQGVVFGHTHYGRDVEVGGRRVAGTPLGYPRERGDMPVDEVVRSRIAWWTL